MNVTFDISEYRNEPRPDRVAFYHIPKCAGTAMRWYLKQKGVNTYDDVPHPSAQFLFDYTSAFRYTIDGHNSFNVSLQAGEGDHQGRHKRALKLSTVRNPFDWMVSLHTHDDNGERGWADLNYVHGTHTFGEFVEKFTDREFPWGTNVWHRALHQNQLAQWFSNGSSVVDVAIRSEALVRGTDELFEALGLSLPGESVAQIPPPKNWSNASRRRSKKNYREYYDDSWIRQRVGDYFSDVLSVLGYDFNGPTDDSALLDIRSLDLGWNFSGSAQSAPDALGGQLVSRAMTRG